MKKYNARTKANIPFDTIAGHQQYIELATIDSFQGLGYCLKETGSEEFGSKYTRRQFSFKLHLNLKDFIVIHVSPTISRVWIESEKFLIEEDEMLGALLFAHVIMNRSQYIKVDFTTVDNRTYMKIVGGFCYPATKEEIDRFADNSITSGIIMFELMYTLKPFYQNRAMFKSFTSIDIDKAYSIFNNFSV